MSNEELENFISTNIACPKCGHKDYTQIRNFQLMFKTQIGVVEDNKSQAYLRPETAQGIFINFKNVQRTTRKKVPFGICQIGKAFRNEITPGNFIFRTREFEQMELEFFCKPGTDFEWYDFWKKQCFQFLLDLGIKEENLQFVEYEPNELAHYAKATSDILYNLNIKKEHLRFRDHDKAALAFYSVATTDIEYLFPFGWGELWGIADRTDYYLKRHMECSGENLT